MGESKRKILQDIAKKHSKPVPAHDFSHVKSGDTVTRMLAGTYPMKLSVSKVDETLIYCGVPGTPGTEEGQFWTFDRKTGVEIDDRFDWGVESGVTGSYLTPDSPETVST